MSRKVLSVFLFLYLAAWLAPAAGQPPALPTISVMNLKPAAEINEAQAVLLTDRLLVELARTGRYEVTERSRRDEILKEVAFQQTGACDEVSCLAQVGKYLGVQKMVGGSVGRLGITYSVNLRMVDVESGRIIQTAVKDYEGSIDYLLTTAMKEVAWQLARGGLSKKEQQELARLQKEEEQRKKEQERLEAERKKEEERKAAQQVVDSLAAVRRASAQAESLKVAEEKKKEKERRMEAQRVADSLAAARKTEEKKQKELAQLVKEFEAKRKKEAALAHVAKPPSQKERGAGPFRFFGKGRKRWAWASLALGVAGGAGALLERSRANSDYSKYQAATTVGSMNFYKQRFKDKDRITYLLLGGSTVCLGSSGLLFLGSRGGNESAEMGKGSGVYLGLVNGRRPGAVLVMRF